MINFEIFGENGQMNFEETEIIGIFAPTNSSDYCIMNDKFTIQLFEGKKVRFVWDAEKEKYYFSVTDIVEVLTDSVNPRDYIKKMLRRDPELKSKWGTICPPVESVQNGVHQNTL